MKLGMEERALVLADYIIENGATVRQAAARYGISKSTVHKDVTDRLYYISFEKYETVKKILELNKAERHIRGGAATKLKYQREKDGRL